LSSQFRRESPPRPVELTSSIVNPDLDSISTHILLGNLYANQGKLAEAEAMYTRALQGREEALGPKHTSTLQTVNNLGLLSYGPMWGSICKSILKSAWRPKPNIWNLSVSV
jgi:hypothetical protein